MTSDDKPKYEGLDLPSVYVSKFQLMILDNVARLVLGEQILNDAPAHYHSAFLLTHADLEALARMIDSLLATTRAKQQQSLQQQVVGEALTLKTKMN